MKKSKFTRSIEKKLSQKSSKKTKSKYSNEYFVKGKGVGTEACHLNFLNMTMPELRRFLLVIENERDWTFSDCEKLWIESDIFEAKTLALYWLDQQELRFLINNHKKILNWAGEADNWAHADQLCSIYARMFENAPSLILPVYLKWNRHKNPWLRRCSMVGTFYYSRQRTDQPKFDLVRALVSPHLHASEYYIQKGVGWTIREMYNVYPTETIEFIENNLHEISSVAWVAASEKLPIKIKQKLLKKRRLNRLQK